MTSNTTNTPSDTRGVNYTSIATAWRPPAPSRGTRNISRRSKGSARAVIITNAPEREIHCESSMERKCALLLLARPDVVDLVEQAPAVRYVDNDGRTKKHTFDFLATMVDGSKIAIEVKPAARVDKDGWRQRLRRIAGQMDGLVVVLVTEANLLRDVVYNATLLHFARHDANAEHDERIRQTARDLHGAVTIAELLERSGLYGDGFRAVVRLLGAGELTAHGRGRIIHTMLVSRVTPA
jgi:hypothetical protein